MKKISNLKMSLVALLLALFATGCPSLSTMQTVDTVPQGELRFMVAGEALGVSDGGGTTTIPQTEVGLRYGITDNIDIGAKVYMIGMEIGAKFQIIKGKFGLSVAPAVAYTGLSYDNGTEEGGDSSFSLVYLHLPVLMGYEVTESFAINFGPKLLQAFATSESDLDEDDDAEFTSSGFMVGGYLALPVEVSSGFWIVPEINVYQALTGDSDTFLFQGGIGLLFGGAEK